MTFYELAPKLKIKHGWHDKVVGQEVEELGEESATFGHKVENRRNAKNHPPRTAA